MRISDWSSDVCSSDLAAWVGEAVRRRGPGGVDHLCDPYAPDRPAAPSAGRRGPALGQPARGASGVDRKSVVSGKSVSVRVDIGGGRIIKKKQKRVGYK